MRIHNLPACLPYSTWIEILMLLVGNTWETDEDAELICGCVFQPRARGIQISLWTSDCEEEEAQLRIGRRLKQAIGWSDRIFYQTVQQQQNVPKGRDSDQGKYAA